MHFVVVDSVVPVCRRAALAATPPPALPATQSLSAWMHDLVVVLLVEVVSVCVGLVVVLVVVVDSAVCSLAALMKSMTPSRQ